MHSEENMVVREQEGMIYGDIGVGVVTSFT